MATMAAQLRIIVAAGGWRLEWGLVLGGKVLKGKGQRTCVENGTWWQSVQRQRTKDLCGERGGGGKVRISVCIGWIGIEGTMCC
jgi:predicted cupin superfamily sugar epimerase